MADPEETDEQIRERMRARNLQRNRESRERQIAELHRRLDAFVGEVYAQAPNGGDGESMAFELTGAASGYDSYTDEPYVSFYLETKRTEGSL